MSNLIVENLYVNNVGLIYRLEFIPTFKFDSVAFHTLENALEQHVHEKLPYSVLECLFFLSEFLLHLNIHIKIRTQLAKFCITIISKTPKPIHVVVLKKHTDTLDSRTSIYFCSFSASVLLGCGIG